MGNQFFRKMIGAVVVGAVGDQYRQAVGSMPRPYQMIGTGLAGEVRDEGIGGIFTKQVFGALEVAIHFVSGNMVETKTCLPIQRLVGEIASACFQQLVGAHDVGLHEGFRSIYGAIHMAFGGEVHDDIWFMGGKGVVQRHGIADIDLAETVVWIVVGFRQGSEIASVGELVHVDDLNVRIKQCLSNHTATDESSAACDQYFHALGP